MPVSVSWHDEAHTVIRLYFHPNWTLEELSEALRDNRRLMTSVEHRVDVIWDASDTRLLPGSVITHFMLHSEDALVPANQGMVIVVVSSPLLRNFAALAMRALPKVTRRMHITDTLQTAETKIVALREA